MGQINLNISYHQYETSGWSFTNLQARMPGKQAWNSDSVALKGRTLKPKTNLMFPFNKTNLLEKLKGERTPDASLAAQPMAFWGCSAGDLDDFHPAKLKGEGTVDMFFLFVVPGYVCEREREHLGLLAAGQGVIL